MTVTYALRLRRAELLTANQRLHWAERSRRTKALRDRGRAIVAANTSLPAAHLTVVIGWPDNRRRDAHNLLPTLKALIDGAVDAGLIPDDDDTHLTGPDLRIGAPSGTPGITRLTLTWETRA